MKILFKHNKPIIFPFGKILFFLFIAILTKPVLAQNSAKKSENIVIETKHYIFTCENNVEIPLSFFEKCDNNIDFYNSFFRFTDDKSLAEKMKITIFSSETKKADFIAGKLTDPSRNSAILYFNAESRQYEIAADAATIETNEFRYGCFYQFMENIIPGTPLWIKAGLSVYLDEEIKIFNFPDLFYNITPVKAALISDLKQKQKNNSLELSDTIIGIITGTADFSLQDYLPHSWAIIEYIRTENHGLTYNKLFWDIIYLINPLNNSAENRNLVSDYFFKWTDVPSFTQEVISFINRSESIEDYYTVGKYLYDTKQFEYAENLCNAILFDDKENSFALYMLGLIKYSDGKYDESILLYDRALKAGGESAALHYAKGISFYEAGNIKAAGESLEKAKQEMPEKYSILANPILQAIKQ